MPAENTQSREKCCLCSEALKDVFGEQASVLVGASIGGRIALKYACHFPVKGLLLIGPGGALEEELVKSYSRFNFPVRIVWGAEDNIISGEDMRLLSEKLPNATLVTYEDAGHSAYVSKPNRFIRTCWNSMQHLNEMFSNAR